MTRAKPLPVSRARCLICGSCLDLSLTALMKGAEAYRAWLSEHRDCRILGMPAAGCTIEGCTNTGIGPGQKCRDHGGTLTVADQTPGD